MIVTDDVYDAFAAELKRRAARIEVGYGFDPGTFFGPLISGEFRKRYLRHDRALVGRNHSALLPARDREVAGRRGFYVDPAAYHVDWTSEFNFVDHEPPGPTLLLYRVRNWEEAVALHNRLLYRVSTSLFVSPDMPDLPEVVGRLKTGSLNINRGTIGASLRLPAVGLGRSSNGVPGGIDLLRFLSTPRSTLVETRPFDASQAVPGVHWNDEVTAGGEAAPLDLG